MGLWSSISGLLSGRRTPRDTRWWGRRGERDAVKFLKKLGYRILECNVDLGYAEADIVCEDPTEDASRPTVVIVEVKTRVRTETGSAAGKSVAPEASITAKKRGKLLSCFTALAKANDWTDRPKRIDVVAVEYHVDVSGRAEPPTIRHHKRAVGR